MTDAQGPGTDVCGECGGPKETSRRGSVKCRKCDTPKRGRTYRLPLTVDEATFNALRERADAAGLSVYVMGRQVLALALSAPIIGPSLLREQTALIEQTRAIPPAATVAQAIRWMQVTERVKPAHIKTKSALLAWAVNQGFRP